MKHTQFTQAIDEVIDLKMRAIDIVLKELVEPLADVGNPEKLIGKKFSSWNESDLALLTKIYGAGEKSPLTDLIFRRKYEEVLALEAEEK